MRRFAAMCLMGLFAVGVAKAASGSQYEVLNPWAEVDPKPVRGISERLTTLEGKKIGLFANYKRSSIPMVNAIEKRLKEKYPTVQTVVYHSTGFNYNESERYKEKFESWLKGVDAVVAAVGD